MRVVAMLFVALFAGTMLLSQSPSQTEIITAAQTAALHAVNCRQGDARSLKDSQADFTPEGWRDFMKHMEGFLDSSGAPTFTATFAPSGKPVLVGEKEGVVHFRIPGSLKQAHNKSSTTYARAALDIFARRDSSAHDGKAIKIQHLKQVACFGASTACQ